MWRDQEGGDGAGLADPLAQRPGRGMQAWRSVLCSSSRSGVCTLTLYRQGSHRASPRVTESADLIWLLFTSISNSAILQHHWPSVADRALQITLGSNSSHPSPGRLPAGAMKAPHEQGLRSSA